MTGSCGGAVRRVCQAGVRQRRRASTTHDADATAGLPRHSCDRDAAAAALGPTQTDDDIVKASRQARRSCTCCAARSRTIEGRAQGDFDAAVRCLWADDPFAA